MDRLGRKPFLTIPVLAVAAIAVSLPLAGSIGVIVGFRMVQGVFGASLYTSCAAICTDLAVPEERGNAVARLSLLVYVGFALGPPVGEFLFDRGPSWAFTAAGALHLAAFVASTRIPETLDAADAARSVDGSTRVHARARRAAVLAPGAAQLCAGIGMAAVFAFLPQYARDIGLGSSGGLFAVYALSALVVRIVIGRALRRFGAAGVAALGLVTFCLGHTVLATAWSPWVPFVGVLLAGVGFGCILPALSAVAVSRSPSWQRGAVLGLFLAANDVGLALGGPVVGAIADTAGFRWTYGAPAIAAAVGLVIVLARLDPLRTVRVDRPG